MNKQPPKPIPPKIRTACSSCDSDIVDGRWTCWCRQSEFVAFVFIAIMFFVVVVLAISAHAAEIEGPSFAPAAIPKTHGYKPSTPRSNPITPASLVSIRGHCVMH